MRSTTQERQLTHALDYGQNQTRKCKINKNVYKSLAKFLGNYIQLGTKNFEISSEMAVFLNA